MVELRYFAGLSAEETADAMGISQRTVERDWALAKAWLRTQLESERQMTPQRWSQIKECSSAARETAEPERAGLPRFGLRRRPELRADVERCWRK